MQKNYNFFSLLLCCCFMAASVSLFAQPVNDECSGAIDISDAFMGTIGTVTNNGPFTLTGATAGANDPPEPGENEANTTDTADPIGPFCADETDGNLFGDPSDIWEQSVWYTWTVPDLNGDGSRVRYSIWTSDGTYNDDCGLNPNSILGGGADTQVAIYEGSQCPDSSTDACDHFAANEDLFSVPPWISGWLTLEFAPGETYYMAVDAWEAAEGDFCLTVVVGGVEDGDGECAPVETYCTSSDCRDECLFSNFSGIAETETGNRRSIDFDPADDLFICSESVVGYNNGNVYLGVIAEETGNCSGEFDLPLELSVGSLLGSDDDGLDTLSSGFFSYIELTPADIATGSLTISSTMEDGLGTTCTSSFTLNFADYPQATDPYCVISCFAGGIEESLLTGGIVACEDGSIDICSNGLEDLSLPCETGDFGYYWRAYVKPYEDWVNVTGWVELGACPSVAAADFLIDRDGSLGPDFTAGSVIQADPYGSGQPLKMLIEGAALCLDAAGELILEGCTATNGPDFFTNVNGTNRTVIPLDYYPAGSSDCASASCTQTINLNAGWNLVSLDVSPSTTLTGTVFNAPAGGNIEFITGFDGGAIIFDPNGPPFLNTLKDVADGFGYWVKATSATTLTVEGACLADDFRKPLDAGWNLTAYPPDDSQAPVAYYDDLIAAGNLEFVTGFDGGTKIFDPFGPPFLNTLTNLQNGFGYWVKVTNPAAKTVSNLTNVFSFINGTSNLPVGQQVKVLSETNETIAILDVVQSNYLMTTPIYGDDATTISKENIAIGENLRFSWNGQIADFETTFKGDYGIEKISLQFDIAKLTNDFSVKAYPVPAKDMLNFEITVKETTDLLVQIFDNKGSLIESIDKTSLQVGNQIINYNVENLAVGIYTYQLITANEVSAGKFNIVR